MLVVQEIIVGGGAQWHIAVCVFIITFIRPMSIRP